MLTHLLLVYVPVSAGSIKSNSYGCVPRLRDVLKADGHVTPLVMKVDLLQTYQVTNQQK